MKFFQLVCKYYTGSTTLAKKNKKKYCCCFERCSKYQIYIVLSLELTLSLKNDATSTKNKLSRLLFLFIYLFLSFFLIPTTSHYTDCQRISKTQTSLPQLIKFLTISHLIKSKYCSLTASNYIRYI